MLNRKLKEHQAAKNVFIALSPKKLCSSVESKKESNIYALQSFFPNYIFNRENFFISANTMGFGFCFPFPLFTNDYQLFSSFLVTLLKQDLSNNVDLGLFYDSSLLMKNTGSFYLFVSKKRNAQIEMSFKTLRNEFELFFMQHKIFFIRCYEEDFKALMKSWVLSDCDSYQVQTKSIDASMMNGKLQLSRKVSFEIAPRISSSNDPTFIDFSDLFYSICKNNQSLSMPFLLTLSIRKENAAVLNIFCNFLLYGEKDKELETEIKKLKNYFLSRNISISENQYRQWWTFLASLPFMLTESLFSSFKMLRIVKKCLFI